MAIFNILLKMEEPQMLNSVNLMGRLVRDPIHTATPGGVAVTTFTVAVDRDFGGRDGGERETDFIDCVAWRQTGEFVSKYFTKGSMIVVSGRLQIRNWTDRDGHSRKTAEVVVDKAYFGGSTANRRTDAASIAPTAELAEQAAAIRNALADYEPDANLPF